MPQARGAHPNLKSRLDEADNKQRQNTAQLAQKANKDEVTNVMTPKGTLAYASLPTSGNQVGWYYYCPDGDGVHGAGNYVWNGTSWFFGGTGDEGYNLLQQDIKNTVGDYNTLEKYFKYKMLKGSKKIMSLKNDVVAPYDDLNTLPIGEIVVFGAFADWDIKNYPNGFPGGTVVTLNSDNGLKLGTVQLVVSPSNLFAYRVYWGDTNEWHSWNIVATSAITDKIEKIEESHYATIGMFQTFGVIGDSYASGVLGQYGNIPHYGLSWGQILARRNGNVCVNFSYGGLSTRTWLTHEKGLTLLQNESAKQLYICDLARNDTALGDNYIGTIADIESGADTYYGNYGKIIKAIKNKNSNAKIILLIAPEIRESFKVAIRNIAQNFNIPFIECSDDTFFTTRYVEYKKVGHPVATEYSGMALAIDRLFSDCVGKYHTYFEDYRFDD